MDLKHNHVTRTVKLAGVIGYCLLSIYELVALFALQLAVMFCKPGMFGLGSLDLLYCAVFGIFNMLFIFHVVGLIGSILAGIGWIMLGDYMNSRLILATGILLILAVALGVPLRAPLYILSYYYWSGYKSLLASQLKSLAVPGLVQDIISAIVGLAAAMLHIKSHFIAASRMRILLFRVAGIIYATSLVMYVAMIALLQYIIGITVKLIVMLVLTCIMLVVAGSSISALAFRLIKLD